MPTVFLDTNVFLYAIGAQHPLKAAGQQVLERVGNGTLEAVTSTEVIQEILYPRCGSRGHHAEQRNLRHRYL
jgi:predicted nucleic acid-binding protein